MKKKYTNAAKTVILGLQNELQGPGDAIHEMWNAWVCNTNPYDIAKYCAEEEMIIIGWFDVLKYNMMHNDCDIGIVAEYTDTGDRIWCHARKIWYANWNELFPELYKE